jgi:hypothetical protein
MSLQAQPAKRRNRFRCACGRETGFTQPGWRRFVRAADHGMCARCWRAVMDRVRAVRAARRIAA